MNNLNNLTNVSSIEAASLSKGEYDAVLVTAGYEPRAVHAAKTLAPRSSQRIACAFTERKVAAFADNCQWFERDGYCVSPATDGEIEEWTSSFIKTAAQQGRDRFVIRMFVDISSMSRLRLGVLLSELQRLDTEKRIVVDFVYSSAEWSPPSDASEPIVSAGSVHPFFAGWSPQPNLKTVAVIGLGYEPDKAVGAYEYLEATDVWAFVPLSSEPRFSRAVNKANAVLLRNIPESKRVVYRVENPESCFRVLESIVYGIRQEARPVLLPFGPKVFALCCLLVACVHRDVPVWRITSGQYGEPISRVASGYIVAVRTVFEPGMIEDETEAVHEPRAKSQSKMVSGDA